MPDHEEAVREAYDEWRGSQSGMPSPRRSFEAGAASERAKYAALVEALQVIVIETNSTMNTYPNTGGTVDPGKRANGLARAALAALQSKEGTNK